MVSELHYNPELERYEVDLECWREHRDAVTAAVIEAREIGGDEAALDAFAANAGPDILHYRPEDPLPAEWVSADGYCGDGGEGYEIVAWSPTRKAILRSTPDGYQPEDQWLQIAENHG